MHQEKEIPCLDVREGIDRVTQLIQRKLDAGVDPAVALIAGGSCSGKTECVTQELEKRFDPSALHLPLDHYYLGAKFMAQMAKKGIHLNWDEPIAVEIELAAQHIHLLSQKQPVMRPTYDFVTGNRTEPVSVFPQKVIFVEGNFALCDMLPSLAHVKVFVEASLHTRMLRRLSRDVERAGWNPANTLRFFSEVVQPMHRLHVEPTRHLADVVIMNNYCPMVEAPKAGLYDTQVKFPLGSIDDEVLRRCGAQRLAAVAQEDAYYRPSDEEIPITEMPRIRSENGNLVFTYHGPRSNISPEGLPVWRRPKFEFEIARNIAISFAAMYGEVVKRVEKARVLYALLGAIVSLDCMRNSSQGRFLEIRSMDNDRNPYETIRNAAFRLGLNLEEGINRSYIEM